jgi:hypothetical protein
MIVKPGDEVIVMEDGYLINGRHYERMGAVLGAHGKPGIDKWRKRIGEEEADRIRDEAGEWGTKVHEATAAMDLGDSAKAREMLKKDSWLRTPMDTWAEWVSEYVKEIIAVELVVYSPRIGVAGTIDRVVLMVGKRKPTIADLKTSSQLPSSWETQTTGYGLMYNEGRRSGRVESILGVHLPRSAGGSKLTAKWGSMEKGFEAFRDLYTDFANSKF